MTFFKLINGQWEVFGLERLLYEALRLLNANAKVYMSVMSSGLTCFLHQSVHVGVLGLVPRKGLLCLLHFVTSQVKIQTQEEANTTKFDLLNDIC